jgi:hypothetical protein
MTACKLFISRAVTITNVSSHDRHKIVGWVCRPLPSSENANQIHLQYLIRLERDDPAKAMSEVLRHPCAEEIDDYKAYRLSCKNQRDAEKRGAEMLEARNKSRAVGDQGRSFKMKIMPVKAGVNAANEGERLPSQDVVSPMGGIYSRTSLGTAAGTTAGVRTSGPRRNTSGKSTSSAVRHSRRNLDGSSDEPHSRGLCVHHESDPGNSTSSSENEDVAQGAHQERIWANLFTPVDWEKRRCAGSAGVSVVEPTVSVRELHGAKARGDFELARALDPRPEHAREFLEAQSKVWKELSEAEYVDREVVRRA